MNFPTNAAFGLILFLSFHLTSCKKEGEPLEDLTPVDPTSLTKGDTIIPFRYIHPSTGDWKVEVRIAADDLLDVSRRVHSRKFTATDSKLLARISKLKFLYGMGRVYKPTSTLRVYDDLALHEQYGVVFEKNYLGLQSKTYGIISCVDQKEFFDILEEMY